MKIEGGIEGIRKASTESSAGEIDHEESLIIPQQGKTGLFYDIFCVLILDRKAELFWSSIRAGAATPEFGGA